MVAEKRPRRQNGNLGLRRRLCAVIIRVAGTSWDWLRAPLPDFGLELLSERALREKGYFEPAFVARLLASRGSLLRGLPLLAVLGVQVWDELFVRGRRELLGQAVTGGHGGAAPLYRGPQVVSP